MALQIKIVWIGKESRSPHSEVEAEFIKRIKQWSTVELVQIPISNKNYPSHEEHMDAEGEVIIEKLSTFKNLSTYLLHEEAKEYSSKEFSKIISLSYENSETLCFVIGGAYGLSRALLGNPKFKKLSLSKMTLPHHFARVLLIEQLYRAFTIISGHPYHK